MTIFLIIYLLGVITTLALIYFDEKRHSIEETEITLAYTILALGMSLFSWCSFLILLLGNKFGDMVLFRINKNGK